MLFGSSCVAPVVATIILLFGDLNMFNCTGTFGLHRYMAKYSFNQAIHNRLQIYELMMQLSLLDGDSLDSWRWDRDGSWSKKLPEMFYNKLSNESFVIKVEFQTRIHFSWGPSWQNSCQRFSCNLWHDKTMAQNVRRIGILFYVGLDRARLWAQRLGLRSWTRTS